MIGQRVAIVAAVLFLSGCANRSVSQPEGSATTTVESNPVESNPVESNPVESNPVHSNTVESNTAEPTAVSFVGIHWAATTVTLDGVTHRIPAKPAATVDFLADGTSYFDDTVNTISAHWTAEPNHTIHIEGDAESAVGYIGRDPVVLAEIQALSRFISRRVPTEPNASAGPTDITETVDHRQLTLSGDGAAMTFRVDGRSPALPTGRATTSPYLPPSGTRTGVGSSPITR